MYEYMSKYVYMFIYLYIHVSILIVFIHESHVVFVYVLLLYSLFVSLLFFVCSPIMEEIKYLSIYLFSSLFTNTQNKGIRIENMTLPCFVNDVTTDNRVT